MTQYDDIQYKRYNFDDQVGLITKDDQLISKLTGSINSINSDVQKSVHDGMKFIGQDFFKVHDHIERAKREINRHTTESQPCLCHLATKDDIRHAVDIVKDKDDRNTIRIEHRIADAVEELKNESTGGTELILSNLNEVASQLTIKADEVKADIVRQTASNLEDVKVEVKTAKYEVKNELASRSEEVKRYINSKTAEEHAYMVEEFGNLNTQVAGLYDI